MFLRSQLSWNVVIPAQNLDAEGLILQKAILIGLLDEFAAKKASKDIGYFLAVTTLDHIGKGIIRQHSGDLLFPVDFSCITFKMFPGEILEGVVHKILKHGVFVKCGPAEKVYISISKWLITSMCPVRTLVSGTRSPQKLKRVRWYVFWCLLRSTTKLRKISGLLSAWRVIFLDPSIRTGLSTLFLDFTEYVVFWFYSYK
ncbi:DNA-directed RNA polymerase V subunit [Sesamum angolense]|uniref:DNA-directed RNA polymerase subunit n=1 Tax=Sesamum angolense TaxID=2727404 RepID=A0AAE2C201_9LAMI|nr:DNA-directed RNA polymerase V subunit [Sesamum angolense]